MTAAVPDLGQWAISCILFSLRIAPAFAFAPPFTLIRTPALFRVLMSIGLATCILSGNARAIIALPGTGALVLCAVRELLLGMMVVLAFQLAFAAIQLVGRTIDIQAGFGLALLLDPTSRAQTPLVGSFFAYLAAAAFFSADGHLDLLRILAATLEAFPLGAWSLPDTITRVTGFMSMMFMMAFGVGGGAVLILFLIDLIIALLSRTVTQMNVLVLGLQIKTFALLLVLPLCLGIGGALLARMMLITLQTLPRLL